MRLTTGFLIVAFVLLCAPAAHAESRIFALGFDRAFDLTTGEDGGVDVADETGVTLWSPEGAKLRADLPPARAPWPWPWTRTDSIYNGGVAGRAASACRKITPAGFTVWNSSTFGSAQGVAVTDGRVFVPTRDRVSILDAATGAPLGESPVLARPGDGFSMFDVDAADHRVYATINGRVHVLDTDGAELFSRHLGEDRQRADRRRPRRACAHGVARCRRRRLRRRLHPSRRHRRDVRAQRRGVR